MPPKLKDIANKLGLSTSTVSLALKPEDARKYRLSQETVELVRETAEKLGYRPNSLAASLRQKRTQTIGILVSQLDFCIGEILDDIIQEVMPEFTPLLTVHNWDGYIEQNELETLADKRVDGIIAAFSGDPKSIATYRKISENYKIPIVLMGRSIPDLNLNVVLSDHHKVTYNATKTLLGSGYTCIQFLGLREKGHSLESLMLRENGYRDAMNETNFGDQINIKLNHGKDVWKKQNLKKFASKVLDSWQKDPRQNTVLFAENDLLAYEILEECSLRAIKVPQDISIMGIGDYPLSSREFVGLSTISEERNGRLAAQILLKLIRGETCKERTFLVPSKTVLRKTTHTI